MKNSELKRHGEKGPEEKEAERPKKVLKVSEEMLTVDGKYVGEIGNPNYREKKDMFEYDPDPKGGLLVNGHKETVMLSRDDLVLLPHDLGHVTVNRILEGREGKCSDREFELKLYRLFQDIQGKLDKIIYIEEALGVSVSDHHAVVDRCIKNAYRRNKNFTPEDVIDALFEKIKDGMGARFSREEIKEKGLDSCEQMVRSTGILDEDRSKSQKAIVPYFYLYLRLKGADTSNSEEIYDKIKEFRFFDELLAEYKKNPDSRFGDALLIALSRIE